MAVFKANGIAIEYKRYGDSAMTPVLVHHGLLGTVTLANKWSRVAESLGVELISVARPGYGRSTPVEMGSIADWASIIVPLLDSLELDQFGVMGISAGAPYSYGLAAKLPERISGVAVLSGLGKVNEPQTRSHYDELWQHVFESFAQGVEVESAQMLFTMMAEKELAEAEKKSKRRQLVDSLANDVAGPRREAIMQQKDWGFELEELSVPVALWHSPKDEEVPFATAEIVASRIPQAVIHTQDKPGHLPSLTTVKDALEFLQRIRVR